MKRFVSILCALIMLLSIMPTAAFATGADARNGIQNQWETTEGISHPAGSYFTQKRLEKMPGTIEAWVYIPGDIYLKPIGTIIGNFGREDDDAFTLSIIGGGIPQLTFHSSEDTVYGFYGAIIEADTWSHIAVVYDEMNAQLVCYINGQQCYLLNSGFVPAPEGVVDNDLCVAGDRTPMNTNAFRGILGDVSVYSDARTEQEIAQDVTGPAMEDPDLLLHYDMSTATAASDIPDASGNGYDLRYERMWLTQEEWDSLLEEDDKEYTYSIAFLPDIQNTTEFFANKLSDPFDYLLENQESKNIRYFITVGDLTNTNTINEWKLFLSQTNRLNNKLPYALVRGNHDALKNDGQPLFDQTYATGFYYQHVQENGGFFKEGSVENTYLLFTVGEIDYLILNLDFCADDEVLKWVDGVLTQYADHRVIVATHAYLMPDASQSSSSDTHAPSTYVPTLKNGDYMWDTVLSKHANVSMIVSGHFSYDGIPYSTAAGENGNTVHQLMMDTQSADKLLKGAGFISLMDFTEDGRYARVSLYSTTLNKYFMESVSWIELDFGEAPDKGGAEAGLSTMTILFIGAGVVLAAGIVIAIVAVTKKKKAKQQEASTEQEKDDQQ